MDVAEIVIYALLALWAALAVRGVLAVAYQKSPLAIYAMGRLHHIAQSIMATNIQTQPITAVAIEAR